MICDEHYLTYGLNKKELDWDFLTWGATAIF